MTYNYVIVSHAGAGSHSKYKEEIYKDVCNRSCKAAQKILNGNKSGFPDLIQAVVEAVKVLENDPCTNAGIGSNLSMNGRIQCDASIMCGQSLRFGAIGAVSNIMNPIVVAAKLLQTQIAEPLMKDGRYPASVLVGSDATQYALDNGIAAAKDEELITVERQRKYEIQKKNISEERVSKLKRKAPLISEPIVKRLREMSHDSIEELDYLSDTVGVIIADSLGRVISATSSGGIFMKQEGRLGQSCMFGCGSYSEQKDNGTSVTAVSTGLGEQLMRTMLPYKTCDAFGSWSSDDDETSGINEQFQKFLDKEFMRSPFLQGDLYRSFGILALRSQQIEEGKMSLDFLFGHSTSSMCFSYLSSRARVPQATMSRKADENTEFVVGSMGEYFSA